MNQQQLFHEDIWQALTDCVRALGGSKAVGHRMRPEMSPPDAGRWLLDCLNPTRAAKLDVEQVLWLLREARKIQCHVGAAFIMANTGYAAPSPVEPVDERSALQRQFVESVKVLQQIQRQMDLSDGNGSC